MSRTKRRNVEDRRRIPAKRPNVADGAAPSVLESEPLRATVDAAFRNDEIIVEALKSNLKARAAVADSIAKRAEAAFEKFIPSSYSEDERARPTYLAPRDELAKVLDEVALKGARALRHTDDSRGIRLTRGDALNKLIKGRRSDGASTLGTIKLGDLVKYVSQGLTAGTSPLPSLRVCDAEEEAERRLTEIENRAAGSDTPGTTPSTDGDSPTGTAEDRDPSTRALVKSKVNGLMGTVVPPEARFRVDPPQRADEEEIAKSIDTFELRDGPSDVTSYHDFNSLQIAFPHVWTEVFDGELESLGKELYKEYVRLKDFAGLDNGPDDKIGTVADLTRLIGEIRALSQLTQNELPGGSAAGRDVDSGNVPLGGNDLRDELWYKVATGSFIGNDTVEWVANPLGAAIGFLGDLLANMQQITWEMLEDSNRLLPGGIDTISAQVEENALSAGQVEIVLKTRDSTATWKGIDFYELDSSGKPVDVVKITNHPHDKNKMQLRTAQVKNGMLAFGKEITFQVHKAHYFLINLDEKLKDRTRVTFTWEKDR